MFLKWYLKIYKKQIYSLTRVSYGGGSPWDVVAAQVLVTPVTIVVVPSGRRVMAVTAGGRTGIWGPAVEGPVEVTIATILYLKNTYVKLLPTQWSIGVPHKRPILRQLTVTRLSPTVVRRTMKDAGRCGPTCARILRAKIRNKWTPQCVRIKYLQVLKFVMNWTQTFMIHMNFFLNYFLFAIAALKDSLDTAVILCPWLRARIRLS